MVSKIVTTIAVLVTFAAIALSQPAPSASLKLGHVPDADFGCGCYLFRNKSDGRNRRYLFVSPMDEPAYLNLNGKTIRLLKVDSSSENRGERIGDRSWEIYSGYGVKVRIDYTVTRVCPLNDENCESHDYKTRMTVTRGRSKMSVNTIGVCGC